MNRDTSLFVAAFAAHVLEEAPRFTAWARRYASDRYTQRDFVRNNALGLMITVAATRALERSPGRRELFFAYYSLVFTQQALFNTVFHAGTTVAWRAYSPGLVTSLTLFLPLWWQLTGAAVEERRITRRGVLAAGALAGATHAAVVARQVFFIGARQARAYSR